MAVAVSSFDEFASHYEHASKHTDLFAFFLYSNRKSHDVVDLFASNQFSFLDELAVTQRLFFYVFKVGGGGATFNPAGTVTRLFNISMSQLPGVLVFGPSKDFASAKGIFFPIHADLFAETTRAENRLNQLFDAIGEVRSIPNENGELIEALAKALPKWSARERWRPVLDYVLGQTRRLVNLPSNLVEKMAEGFAKGLISSP
jgi:hypothetical protein